VTNAPLIMQLRNRLPSDAKKQDYATIRAEADPMLGGEAPQAKEILDLNMIEHEIRQLSTELTTRHKAKIVDVPIHLTIYRQGQFDLTLYDLPGIFYGDRQMEDTITHMWRRYISKPNAVILYTIPC
jgi:hypothetical protein